MKRLTPAFLTVIMLLFVGGLVVAYIAKTLLAREVPVAEDPRVVIPVAVADLKPGVEITAAHLATAPYRASSLDPKAVRADKVLIGRVVREEIKAAAPILTTQLYPPGEHPPLDVSDGMRAMSLTLGDGTAVVSGLVHAGQFVDVHFTPASYPDQSLNGGMTMTLFKGVKVLAINRNTSGSGGLSRGQNAVTLELTKGQVNILTLAQQKGMLNLTYTPDGQGDGGVAISDEDRATFEEILGLAPPKKPEPPHVTEIFNGTGRSILAFKDGLRADQYGLLRYDYNQRGGYGYGGYGGGFGYGVGPSNNYNGAPLEPGGYWSVPNSPAPAGNPASRGAGALPNPAAGNGPAGGVLGGGAGGNFRGSPGGSFGGGIGGGAAEGLSP